MSGSARQVPNYKLYEELQEIRQAIAPIADIKQTVDMHDRVLRGNNGTPGLVAAVDHIIKVIEPMSARLTERGCLADVPIHKEKEGEGVTWRFIVEKLVAPVITGITVAVLLYFVLG